VKVTVDVDPDTPEPLRELLAAARAERATGDACQARGLTVAVAAALLVVVSGGLATLWMDAGWGLNDTEHWILRAVFALAIALLVVASAVGAAAAWPRAAPASDVAAALAPVAETDERRTREALHALVDRAREETLRRGRLLQAAAVLFVLGVTALAAHALVFVFLADFRT
jgi:hypothetical protein